MSSAKRRAKRKIAQLVRMDWQRMRMTSIGPSVAIFGVPDKKWLLFVGCMVPLGKKLRRMGLEQRARAALEAARSDLQ